MNPVADHPELVPVFFCMLGLLFAALGLTMLARARRFARRAVRTTGSVVDLARRWSDPGGPESMGGFLYFPIVRFGTADGQAIQFRSPTGTSWRSHRVGQTVPVLYDPANPRDARINTFMMTGLLPGCFVAFGAFFVVLSVAILLLMRWASSILPH